eukprot:5544456-Alexandrium_andersonii.AAC.1
MSMSQNPVGRSSSGSAAWGAGPGHWLYCCCRANFSRGVTLDPTVSASCDVLFLVKQQPLRGDV